MKKNIIFAAALALMAMMTTSCDKDSEGLSTIVDFPKLTIQGDEFYISPIGQQFVDPGCTATFQGQDYTANVVSSGVVDINTAGLYPVTYSATGPNGYSWSESRTVAVCDPSITTNLAGTWTLQSVSYRNYNGTEAAFGSEYSIKITQLAPGIFHCSDFFGGWYDQRAGYGARYACVGNFQLTADGGINILSGNVAGWGDSIDDAQNASYDAETNTLTWDVYYAGSMFFHVVLTK